MSAFEDLAAISPQLLADGWLARVIAGERMTVAVVEADPGAVLPEHHHHNEQFGMVITGSIRFRVADEERTLGPGGTWRIPPDTSHTATAGDEGAVVVDVFSPPREDWASHERLVQRPPAWP